MLLSSIHFIRIIQKPLIWLVLIKCFILAYFYLEHEGFNYGDDNSYSTFANQVLHGDFHFDNYSFSHRFMVFVPTAFFYWLCGINVYTTTLWPLICTLGTLLLVYLTFYKQHPLASIWALILIGLYYFQLTTVNFLFPDNILLFFTTACLLILYKARYPLPTYKTQISLGITFAFLNLLAFLTKETIVYSVPFYVCLFLYHLKRGENMRFWTATVITGIALLSIYFLLYHSFTGNALQRLYDIKATNTVETKQEYLDTRALTLPTRLTYEPLLFFITTGLAIPLAFGLLSFSKAAKVRIVNLHQPQVFWVVALGCMLFHIWFGTATVDFYKPMPLEPRMFHPLLPAFCLSAGLTLERAWNIRSSFLFLAIVFGLCALLAGGNTSFMYILLTLFFTGVYFVKRSVPQWLGFILVTLILSIRPIYYLLKPSPKNYFKQEAMMKNRLQNASGTYEVLTDSTILIYRPFIYSFNPPKNYKFKGYAAYNPNQVSTTDTIFIFINTFKLNMYLDKNIMTEEQMFTLFPHAKLVHQEGEHVKLYYLPHVSGNK